MLDIYYLQKNSIAKKVTISGGNPLEQGSRLLSLLEKLKLLGYNVWVYSGFTFDYIKKAYPNHLKYIDVIVDGPFMADLKDEGLQYMGSSNQRIIYLNKGVPYKVISHMGDYDL